MKLFHWYSITKSVHRDVSDSRYAELVRVNATPASLKRLKRQVLNLISADRDEGYQYTINEFKKPAGWKAILTFRPWGIYDGDGQMIPRDRLL